MPFGDAEDVRNSPERGRVRSELSEGADRYRYPAGMGLLSSHNLRMAKDLLEKNRHKVGDMVEKAGGTIDKVSGGKTASVTSKASEAAKKYSDGTPPKYGTEVPVDDVPRQAMSAEEARVRQSQATAGAANAVKGAADALTNLMNKAAAQAEQHSTDNKPDGTESSR